MHEAAAVLGRDEVARDDLVGRTVQLAVEREQGLVAEADELAPLERLDHLGLGLLGLLVDAQDLAQQRRG